MKNNETVRPMTVNRQFDCRKFWRVGKEMYGGSVPAAIVLGSAVATTLICSFLFVDLLKSKVRLRS